MGFMGKKITCPDFVILTEQIMIDTKSQGEQIKNKFCYLPELTSDEKENRNIMKHKTSSK